MPVLGTVLASAEKEQREFAAKTREQTSARPAAASYRHDALTLGVQRDNATKYTAIKTTTKSCALIITCLLASRLHKNKQAEDRLLITSLE